MVYNAGRKWFSSTLRTAGSEASRGGWPDTDADAPKNGSRRLLHGTFYARHVLDEEMEWA